jgi:hypothetical protein
LFSFLELAGRLQVSIEKGMIEPEIEAASEKRPFLQIAQLALDFLNKRT